MQTHMFIIQGQVLHSYNFRLKPIDSPLGTSENVSAEDPIACTLHLIYLIWIQRFWFGEIMNDTEKTGKYWTDEFKYFIYYSVAVLCYLII